MKRLLLVALATGMTSLMAAPVGAFWLGEVYNQLERGREQNNLWPHQFVEADRRNAMAPFDTMIRNGWRRQNLLGSHHFTPDGAQLTEAGKLRVQWILTQTPESFRQVFVERSLDQEINESRIAATNEFASVVTGMHAGRVTHTHILTDGRPATVVDFVNTRFRENMATPALPGDSYNTDAE